MISPILIDFENRFPMDWMIETKDIDKKGFSYLITVNSLRKLNKLKFDWVAIDNEESLEIKYYNNFITPNMKYENKTDKIRINFDRTYDEPPLVWVTLTGFSMFDGRKHYIEKSIEKIDQHGFTLVFYNGGVSLIE